MIEVQVWDGVNQLQVFANLQGFGDRRSTLDANNSFVLPASAVIRFGVGISVRVQFETIGEQRIDFAAAGAEFELQPVFLRAFPFLMLLRKKP